MSIAGLLISLVLAFVAAAIVMRPLVQSQRGDRPLSEGRLEQLAQLWIYYERVLTNIRDLDEDLATGKISDEDHLQEREVWAQRGIILLRALDELDREFNDASGDGEAERIDRAIEAAIIAYREGDAASSRNAEGGERV